MGEYFRMNTVLGCVILNYNTWSETIKCAESLIHYYSKSELIIYIVDNASSIKKTYEFTDFIEINKNVHIRAIPTRPCPSPQMSPIRWTA